MEKRPDGDLIEDMFVFVETAIEHLETLAFAVAIFLYGADIIGFQQRWMVGPFHALMTSNGL